MLDLIIRNDNSRINIDTLCNEIMKNGFFMVNIVKLFFSFRKQKTGQPVKHFQPK